MNAQKFYPAIVGSCFAVFAACTGAQTPQASTAPPATSTAAPTNNSAATDQQQAAPSGTPAKAHHAKKHNAMHAAPRTRMSASSEETQYRTALRRCVEGQASQRDRCLDDAISRYGRS